MRIKRKLFISFKNTNDKEVYKKYKTYRDLINTLCRKSKKLYYKSFFTTNANNLKKPGNGKTKDQLNYQLIINGLFSSDKKKIANKFNHYFVNVADSLCKKIPQNNNRYQDRLPQKSQQELFISPRNHTT